MEWRCGVTRGRSYTWLVGWTEDIIERNSDFFSYFLPSFFRLFVFLLPHLNSALPLCLYSRLSLLSRFPRPILFFSSFLCFDPRVYASNAGRRYRPLLLSVCLSVLIFTGRRLRPGSEGSHTAVGRHARHRLSYAGRH
jgi:hypothetical protein